MGFFYQNTKATAKKSKKGLDNLQELAYAQGCKACPLNKPTAGLPKLNSPKMKPTGFEKTSSIGFFGPIYILGEAPGEDEDYQGIQFIGRSGQILRMALENVFNEDLDQFIRWNNCARCRPRTAKGSNRAPTELEVECCRKSIEDDILQYKPAVIVAFGNIPLKWCLGVEGITMWRGRFVPISIRGFKTWLYPMIHPSYILRGKNKKDDPWEATFNRDIERLKDWLLQEKRPKPEVVASNLDEGIVTVLGEKEEDLETIKEALDYFKTKKDVALDIETIGLRPFDLVGPFKKEPRMLSVAIGTDEEVIAFPLDHPKAWNVPDKPVLIETLFNILEDFLYTSGTKIVHNLKFELEWFHHRFGPGVLYETEWTDTQAMSYLLNERTNKQTKLHSLDSVCLLLFGIKVKRESTVDRDQDLSQFPLDDLLRYNGRDAKYTYKACHMMLPKLGDARLDILNLLNKTAKTLVRSQYQGICLNLDVVKTQKIKMENQITATLKKIYSCPEVKEFEKQFETEFKPTSSDHLVVLFRDILGLDQVKKTSKEGYSTDHTVLEQFAGQGIKSAEYSIQLREQSKLYSTYIEPAPTWISRDGIVHTQYNHLGTGTGRLSSSNPVNVQNFPNKKGAWVREMVCAPPGKVMVAFDQGQIEARCIAMASHDPIFSEAIKNDYDIHKEWAINILKLYPRIVGARNFAEVTDAHIKFVRKRAKNELVFPWFYLAGVYSVGHSLGLPDRIVEKLYDEFWQMFAGVKKWQEEMIEFYNKHGYVLTLTGRKRHEPLDLSMIVNSPIQGTASDIVVESGNRTDEMAYEMKRDDLIYVLEIHDDLTYYLYEDRLEQDIPLMAEQLVKPVWPFINDIPLSVECKVGRDWFHMEEVAVYRTGDF